ncbi:MAG: hypothetical protein CMP91_08990 [Gammaproteobacteria bacterium]|mgnify:CR=1 FL=1|nr:hypothetical protein [Gammaproteobacteria bacterium]MAY02311.1 hypothetical protein [Gammaproteobacteria bacterium]|tara:strand:+ start:438393 stop:438863 length:471 start_codon:yes stop_codon:yes gene_type:complete
MAIWLVGILCFVVGLAAGALLCKQFFSDSAKVDSLSKELEKLQETHKDYQQSVYSHFENTAGLVNTLAGNYKALYERLARDADILCPEDVTNQLALSKQRSDLLGSDQGSELEQKMDDLFPPRDYATKSSPDQKGGLAADYGLDKNLDKKDNEQTH